LVTVFSNSFLSSSHYPSGVLQNGSWLRRVTLAVALTNLWQCGLMCRASDAVPVLIVPYITEEIRVDGQLDESCYRTCPPLTNFVAAGEPGNHCPATRAWLFWRPEELVFAFDVTDSGILALPPSGRERDVDAQDRVEIFLWSGRTNDTYYCIEAGARGAVHDYSARFYRKFNDAWNPPGLKVATSITSSGYRVEGRLSRSTLAAAGFQWRAGLRLRCGLFRADFAPEQPESPNWICWVDARGAKPDFHVAESFGEIVLGTRSGQPSSK
jgi:hypothetical protein